MAIFHFNITMISRNKGRSSVTAAARHACEKLYDNRLGKAVRIINKHNLIFKLFILTKTNMVQKDFLFTSNKLWQFIILVAQ